MTILKLRFLSLLTALCLALSLAGPALAADADTRLETIRALGILSGDESGNLNLSSPVTRAEFVKMMTAASTYQDAVGTGQGASLFTDVKSGYWANGYIQLAVEQEWVTGYVDGSFRPGSSITLEEACAALLRLLGYDSGSLSGSFPEAQLSKARSLGLLDGLSRSQGQTLTRQDCVTLFYNLLVSQSSGGTVYGASLGYTITNGEVDYSTLVTADTKGPYVADSGSLSLPFSTSGITVYRNGTASELSAVQQYDVYYYNENLRTVWIYSDRVTGTLTAVSPGTTAPTSVTVAGGTYELGTSTAVYQFSSQGDFSAGDTVTLLLGMNGEVVQAVSAAEADMTYYGVVLSSTKGAADDSTTSEESTSVQTTTVVACTDGTQRTFYHSGSAYSAGRVVSVTIEDGATRLRTLSSKGLEGDVSRDGSSLGSYDFADDVEILDVDDEGGYARIYPDRLAGAELESDDVSYYSLNELGEIDRLILNQVTGDTYTYAFLVDGEVNSENLEISASYTYLLDGETYTVSGTTNYNITHGGIALIYNNGSISSIRQLESVTLSQLSDLYAMAGNKKYMLADDMEVLLKDSSSSNTYYVTTLSEINDEDYRLTGWYDNLDCAAGGRIRILVAVPK